MSEKSRMIVWELVKNSSEVVDRMTQTRSDYEENGNGNMLADFLPLEHEEDAQAGEWDEEGFNYHVGDDAFLVREQIMGEQIRDAIPEPDTYQIRGYAVLEGVAKEFGHTAHVTVARKYLGMRVKIVVLDP